VFRDVTEEYDLRDKQRRSHELLSQISSFAQLDYFYYNLKDERLNRPCYKFWPKNDDGTVFEIENWVYPEDVAEFKSKWHDLLTGRIKNIEISYRVLDQGVMRYFVMWGAGGHTSSSSNENKFEEVFGFIQEVTQHKEAQLTAEKDRLVLRALLDNLPVGICVKNPDNELRFVLCNKLYHDKNGLNDETVVGRTGEELGMSPEIARSVRKSDESAVESGRILFSEEVLDKNGNMRNYDTTKDILRLSTGERLLVITNIETTCRVRLEMQLRETLNNTEGYIQIERVINKCLQHVTLQKGFVESINFILQEIGRSSGSDRCVIYRYSEDMSKMNNEYEWCADGIVAHMPLRRNIPTKTLPDLLDIFAEYDAVVINDTENCDNPKFAVLANFLREKEVKSAIFLPINSGSRLVGFIGASFLRIKHNFSDGAVYILRSAVNMYLLAHAREMQRRNLLRSEKEKNTIWESMPIPLALFNPQRQIVRVNPALERLTHKTSKQVVAGSCFKIFFERSVPCEDCPFDYVMRTGEGASRETTIFDREYRIMALPIFEDDRLVNILQCYVDVTLSNQVKRELEAALEAAQSANQAKSVFLATMSHEIRTPLNAVIGFSELLHNNNELSEPERLEYLKSINLGGRALLLLINDILDLSKLEAGKMVLNTEKCNLNNLISELRSIFALRAKEKSLELNLHINSDLPGMYLCVQRLRQVLLNLLGNAVKFTNCGEINIDVDFVKQDFEQGVLTIKVADTGIGIAKSCQEQIFKPFIQQNRSSQEGTGLGLAISKRLVDDMNGTLTFVSVENK
ncbi:MAG: ATP-binding protein, partial [Victivallaceae bacterium]